MSAAEQLGSNLTSRTVMSHAREPVEVFSDADWAELGGTITAYRTTMSIALALWHHGTIKSPNGRATGLLHPLAQEMGYGGTALGLMSALNSHPLAFAREIKAVAKRTYSITLVALPEKWLSLMQEMEPESFAEPEPEPTPLRQVNADPETKAEPEPETKPEPADSSSAEFVIDLPEYVPPPEPLPEPSPYLEVSATVAMALLTQVVEIISAGSPEQTDQRVRKLSQDVAELADKLSRRLSENDALRRKARELGDELNAVKYERDALRTRLRMTESNLQAALKSDVMQHVNERVMKELEKVMRVVPSGTRKGAD